MVEASHAGGIASALDGQAPSAGAAVEQPNDGIESYALFYSQAF